MLYKNSEVKKSFEWLRFFGPKRDPLKDIQYSVEFPRKGFLSQEKNFAGEVCGVTNCYAQLLQTLLRIIFISVMAAEIVCAASKTRANCSLESPCLYKKLRDDDARVACLPEGSLVCEKHRYYLTKSDFCGGNPIWSEHDHHQLMNCPKRLFDLLDALGESLST